MSERRGFFHCGVCGEKVGASEYRRLRGPEGVDHMWCALGITEHEANLIAVELSGDRYRKQQREEAEHRKIMKLSRAHGNIL